MTLPINGQNILITGGCGFIGTALIRRLREHYPDVNIVVLDNLLTGTLEDLRSVAPVEQVTEPADRVDRSAVALVEGDVRDASAVARSAEGCAAVVHLAANTGVGPSVEDPRLDMEVNVGGTFNVLEAARLKGVPRVVFASSGAPAGEVEPPIHEELPPHPVSPYGASKLAGEGYCSAYNRTFGIDTVCLRFGNVYGPGSGKKMSVVAKFIREALSGEPCRIYGDGEQTRDFLYIDDLIRAVEQALLRPVGGETFQIATGMERTVGEMAESLRECLAERGVAMEIAHEGPRLGDVKRNFSDITKARKLLDWAPEMELRDGLNRTVQWFLHERGDRR
ncbi:NAD-dependent epimerase/dehydratase family protein [Thioalkalivibrio sp. ALR17-21]|uniref:NAD-dependent epimerase/dehydratase family protein n=1 Tax=Thioalkalivibrio sp. ALR17-21 TaxID=1269813 RepID=UPI0004A2F628|nr:NAD-dependent epimerase/dehydratase family protein [Thioalkalivibrio sp. ALR17-21]